MNNTQIAKADDRAFEPRDASEAMTIAAQLVASRLLPAGIQTPEAAFAIIATGRELGLTMMQALRSIHIIKGKPTLSADLILALVKRSAVCKRFQLVNTTHEIATYATHRDGEDATEMSFTIQQAQRACLIGNENWKKYPEAMLRARCIAALARAVYPDVVLGIYETDEMVESAGASQLSPIEIIESLIRADKPKLRIVDSSADFSQERCELSDGIAGANTINELFLVAAEIKKQSTSGVLSSTRRAELAAEFSDRKKQLSHSTNEAVAES